QVSEELGVRALLIGRLDQRGDSLSISAELVDAEDDSVLWGNQYSRRPAEILAVQDEIAKEISQKLRLQLSGEEQKQLAKRYTQNPEAYQSYLQGRYHWNKRTKEGFEKAVQFFNQAIQRDPSYAQAYAGLADTYSLMAFYEHRTPNEVYPLARTAALRALEIDNTLAEAHNSLAWIKAFYDWDWSSAEAEFKRAIELNPNYATAHQWYGALLSAHGQLDEGAAEIEKALALNPLSLQINTVVGLHLVWEHQYEKAIEQLQKTLEMDPSFFNAHEGLMLAYWDAGMYENAITESEKLASLRSDRFSQLPIFLRQVVSGNRAEAIRTLENWRELSSWLKAYYYALLGEKDRAIEWLNKCVDERTSWVSLINAMPTFEPLRNDPRFTDLLRRMRLAP
ncbi:MAG: tetratricopeptide repeat protein, partial [Acidobacteriota bacterium]